MGDECYEIVLALHQRLNVLEGRFLGMPVIGGGGRWRRPGSIPRHNPLVWLPEMELGGKRKTEAQWFSDVIKEFKSISMEIGTMLEERANACLGGYDWGDYYRLIPGVGLTCPDYYFWELLDPEQRGVVRVFMHFNPGDAYRPNAYVYFTFLFTTPGKFVGVGDDEGTGFSRQNDLVPFVDGPGTPFEIACSLVYARSTFPREDDRHIPDVSRRFFIRDQRHMDYMYKQLRRLFHDQ